jgi:hypothetical protein
VVEAMIVFLLWAIVLILFWPLALIIGLGYLLYLILRIFFGITLFAAKAAATTAVMGGSAASQSGWGQRTLGRLRDWPNEWGWVKRFNEANGTAAKMPPEARHCAP